MERCWCRGRSGAQRSAARTAQHSMHSTHSLCSMHVGCLACRLASWLCVWKLAALASFVLSRCTASFCLCLVISICRELLGKHLHFEVLQGASAIEEAAADEQPAAAAAGSTATAAAGAAAGAAAAASSSKRPPPPAAAKWVRQRPAVLLPWGTGMPQMPVQLRLDGELMQFRWAG